MLVLVMLMKVDYKRSKVEEEMRKKQKMMVEINSENSLSDAKEENGNIDGGNTA